MSLKEKNFIAHKIIDDIKDSQLFIENKVKVLEKNKE